MNSTNSTSRMLVRVSAVVGVGGALLLFPTLSGDAFSPLSAKWSSRSVSYYVNATNADVDPNLAILAVQDAATAWTQQSSADFRFVYAGTTTGTAATYNAKNEVLFRNTSSGSAIATTYSWFSGGQLLDTDIVFWDGAFRFFTGTSGCSSGFYIEDIGTHEFGHALGLGHSTVGTATMFPSTTSCNKEIRLLDPDDVAGVESLYPSGSAQPPSAPTNLTASVDSTSPTSAVVLNWTDTSSNEGAMLVERRSAGSSTWTQIASLPSNTTSYRSTGLSAGQGYDFRVRASNSAGFSGYTNTATITTMGSGSTSPPSAPTAVSPADNATRVSRSADLFWQATGATSYDVYVGTSATLTTPYATNVTASSLALPRLSRLTTYYWKVVARNASGTTSGPTWTFRTRS